MSEAKPASGCTGRSCCSADRVSIDRDALRVLCLTAGNLCRLRTDKRVAAVRAALNRLDADWKQHQQNDQAQARQ